MRNFLMVVLLGSSTWCAFGQTEVPAESLLGGQPLEGQRQATAQPQTTLAGATATPYVPLTGEGRMKWVVKSTLGPASLIAGVFTAARQTAANSPPEDGPHWDGFARRYGMRLSARATSNLMEAGIGSMWGEDPRYFRAAGQPMGKRLLNVVKGVYMAHDREGHETLAYARYIAIPSSSFLTNAWRPDSQTRLDDSLGRIGTSVLNRVIGNAFSEFFPDLKQHFKKKK